MASTESAGGGRDRVLAEGPLWKLSDTLRMWRPRYAVLTVFTARTPVLRYWKSSHERWGASGPRGFLYPQMARESSALTGDSAPGADAEPATRDARGGDAPAHALPLRRGRGPRELVFLAAPATSVVRAAATLRQKPSTQRSHADVRAPTPGCEGVPPPRPDRGPHSVLDLRVQGRWVQYGRGCERRRRPGFDRARHRPCGTRNGSSRPKPPCTDV